MAPIELKKNLVAVEERIERACNAAGRRREEVLLLAVTKVFPAQAVVDAHALGLREFGENYVQEFEGKRDAVASLPGARFHLIGHLQSNKAARAGEIFHVIETVDSVKLAQRLDAAGRPLDVYIEVKLSPEGSKAGVSADEAPELAAAIGAMKNLKLRGLMTMPPWSEDSELSRPYFKRLKKLADALGLGGLSMGMSHDLEVAIEEGSTVVRVGTALFGSRRKV